MKNASLQDKTCLTIATLFGVGFTPLCPGTAACIVGVGVFLFIKVRLYFFIFTFISLILSFLLSGRAERLFGEKDCKKIVIDDFSGMLISLLFIPRRIEFIIVAFFLFRAFDMLKIPPADKIEDLQGSRGIVGDDVVAGVYTNIILQAVRLLLKISS